MNSFNKVYNWKNIYSYPFSREIQFFFVLGDTNIYTLSKDDFEALKKYLISKNIETMFICSGEDKNEFYVKDFKYEEYFEKYFSNIKDHFISWWENAWIAMSEESFWLVWWDLEFLKFIISEVWEEKIAERFSKFIVEWDAWKINTWASGLLNRENFLDLQWEEKI